MEPKQKLPRFLELFRASWGLYRERFLKLLLVGIPPALLFILGGFTANWGAVSAVFTFAGIIVYIMYTPAMIWMLDKNASLGESYGFAARRFFPYLWVSALVNLVVMGGVVMGVIPGIIFGIWFSIVTFTFLLEDRRGMDALMASKAYVRGYFWPVLGRFLLVSLIVGLIAMLISLVLTQLGPVMNQIGTIVLQLVLIPFVMVYMLTLYRALQGVKPDISALVPQEKKGFFIFSAVLGILAPIILIAFLGFGIISALLGSLPAQSIQ